MAALLTEIDRDANALVPVVFDGIDGVLEHAHRLAEGFGNVGFAGAGAQFAGVTQHIGGELAQLVLAVAEFRCGHRQEIGKGTMKCKSYNDTL